jgi:hypothetical protein
MAITLRHDKTGLIKKCPEGFSWTTLLFGIWVPVFRGMWSVFFTMLLTLGWAVVYYMFTINRIQVVKLLEEGYLPFSESDYNRVSNLGIRLEREI